MAQVGRLEVALRAEIGQLQADLRRAEAATKKTSSKMQADFKALAASVKKVKGNAAAFAGILTGVAAGAMANFAKQSIRTANDLGDIAQKLGVSAGALQEFQFAAGQSGVSMTALNTGLQRFGRRAAEAAQGTGEARNALAQLGIQLKDSQGNLRSTEALFTDAMHAIAEVENPLERVRLGFKLFDTEGVGLVNMANDFDNLREKAQRLGLVIDDEVVAQADILQDSFDALAAVTKGQLSNALTDIGGGALLRMAETMASLATYANKVYRTFADTEALGLANSQLRLAEATQELAEAEQDLDNAVYKTLAKYNKVKDLKAEIAKLEAQILKYQRDRDEAEKKRQAGVNQAEQEFKTAQERERLEKEIAKGIDGRRSLAKKAHEEYLQQSGQKIRLIEEQLAADIEALTTNLQEHENYSDAIVELEKAAALKIKEVRDEQAKALKDAAGEAASEFDGLFNFMERGFSDAMASMLLDGEITFKQLAMSFAREFLQMGIGQLAGSAFAQIGKAATTLLYGPQPGDLGFMGPVATANGGARLGGRPLLVGERGPELFIPSTSGFVANNNALGKMAGNAVSPVNVTVINNTGQEATTSQKDGPGGSRDIEVMIGAAISKNISRGGDVDRAIRASYGVQRIGRHGL